MYLIVNRQFSTCHTRFMIIPYTVHKIKKMQTFLQTQNIEFCVLKKVEEIEYRQSKVLIYLQILFKLSCQVTLSRIYKKTYEF